MEFLYEPWPWYIAGPVIGLTVPALLLLGNKRLGISSTLRQLCAACYPSDIPFLNYDWKKDSWNLFFVCGILLGGFIGGWLFENPATTTLAPDTVAVLQSNGVHDVSGLLPRELFTWSNVFTWQGFWLIIVGGFMIGFGTRYARGCTSGHGIFGLSALQWTSLVAVICFFVGGIICSHLILPAILLL
ncbi:YeeE/YedE thiosulfate transporter family protein [Chryseolinea sp. H1M3-3]|uniref:YeeE/YedE family protein n=1 Tax=Chryseolinea sp. H1M3-3 TaxID=3034144 RepID=UPI0023EC9A9E|nr:YeeE/YedE thiosulfate transporter family protein [Chryseolinea sp. H1M3-3]